MYGQLINDGVPNSLFVHGFYDCRRCVSQAAAITPCPLGTVLLPFVFTPDLLKPHIALGLQILRERGPAQCFSCCHLPGTPRDKSFVGRQYFHGRPKRFSCCSFRGICLRGLRYFAVRSRCYWSDSIPPSELGDHLPELAGIARHPTAWTLQGKNVLSGRGDRH